MVRIGVLTDVHGQENAGVIAKVLAAQNVDKAFFLGDVLYKTQTDFTNTNTQIATLLRQALLHDTSIRDEVMKGVYNDSLLEKIREDYDYGDEINEKTSTAEYKKFDNTFSEKGISLAAVLGGNWDREKPINEVYNERYLNNTARNIEGLNVFGVSGGGSPPRHAFRKGLLADDKEEGEIQHRTWKDVPLEEKIDVLATHVPPFFKEDGHVDVASEHLKELLNARINTGKEFPSTVMSGHAHGTTSVEIKKITTESGNSAKTVWVRPGVAAVNHNQGSYGSFIIADFDDDSKQIEKVIEFRIYNSIEGVQEVELHGEHVIDLVNEEVKFTEIGKKVLSEHNSEQFKHNLTLDKNYELQEKGLNINYADFDAAGKDLLLRQNLSISVDYKDEIIRRVKLITDAAHRNITSGELDLARYVFEELTNDAAQQFNIVLENITDDEAELHIYRNILTHAAFGIHYLDIKQEIKISDTDNPSFSLGSKLIETIGNNVYRKYEHHIIKDLEAEDFQEMAEVYMPINIKRSRELAKDKAIGLYSQAFQKGLLTGAEATATGAYKEDSSITLTPKTKEEIAELLGHEHEEPQTLEETIGSHIEKGGLVFEDDEGNYVLTPRGKEYLTPEMTENLDYTAKTMKEAIDEGIINPIELAGNHFLRTPQGL